jgi:hypothetical protein
VTPEEAAKELSSVADQVRRLAHRAKRSDDMMDLFTLKGRIQGAARKLSAPVSEGGPSEG